MANPNETFADQRFVYPSPGIGQVGQYQMSGIPFASASIGIESGDSFVVSFPYVTKFVTIINSHVGSPEPLRFGFSQNGVDAVENTNYVVLGNGESYTGELRVSKVFLRPDLATATTASVIAGMTGINSAYLATNWTGTSGVG